jgi:hypothetical protein
MASLVDFFLLCCGWLGLFEETIDELAGLITFEAITIIG